MKKTTFIIILLYVLTVWSAVGCNEDVTPHVSWRPKLSIQHSGYAVHLIEVKPMGNRFGLFLNGIFIADSKNSFDADHGAIMLKKAMEVGTLQPPPCSSTDSQEESKS